VLCSGLSEQTSPDEATLLQKTPQTETMTVRKPRGRGGSTVGSSGSNGISHAKCEDFMAKITEATRESGLQVASEAVVSGADATASSVLGVALLSASDDTLNKKILGAVASCVVGPFAATAAGFLMEFMLPDPNNERITNLQTGVSCLNQQMQQLEKSVQKLEKDAQVRDLRINELRRRPLVKMVAKLSILVRDHSACSSFVWCVRAGYKAPDCFHAYHQEMHWCNADAFADQIQKETHYHFLREAETEKWNKKEMSTLVNSSEWQSVKHLVVQYIAVLDAVQYDWNSLEEWAAALCTPHSGLSDVCSEEDIAKIATSFQIYKWDIIEPWSRGWWNFFNDLKISKNAESLKNSPARTTKTLGSGDCVYSKTKSWAEWRYYSGNHVPEPDKIWPVWVRKYDCSRWTGLDSSDICGESCYVNNDKEALLKANGCYYRECRDKRIYHIASYADDCGWFCHPINKTFTYAVMTDPINESAIQGFKLADKIRTRKINIPPYNSTTASHVLSEEASDTCPDGYMTEEDEEACRSIANQWCDIGYKYPGAWKNDPAGCFIANKAKSKCSVWFNKLTPSMQVRSRWKLCRKKVFTLPDNTIRVKSKQEMCFHAKKSLKKDDAIQLYPCTAATNEQFVLGSDSTIRVKSKPEMCLHAQSGDLNQGDKIQLYPCTAARNQQFVPMFDSTIRVKSKPDMCFSAQSGHLKKGDAIQLSNCSAARNEQFQVRVFQAR